jgi:hypothetical protein
VRELFAELLIYSIILGGWFVVELGPPWRSLNPPIAWLQASLAWSAIVLDSILLLVLFRVHAPLWVYAVPLVMQGAAFTWRVIVLRRIRRADKVARE